MAAVATGAPPLSGDSVSRLVLAFNHANHALVALAKARKGGDAIRQSGLDAGGDGVVGDVPPG
jgi:hypothetical protein